MPASWNRNRLTAKLGIADPIIQGPLGGLCANLSTCTDVWAFLISLVEEVSEIAGPIMQWSAARREK